MKYLAYIPLVLALLGSVYGGLRIASQLQTTLEINTQMAEDAHNRISNIEIHLEGDKKEIENELEMELEKLGFKIDNNKSTVSYQIEDFQRELLQVQKMLTMLDGITQSLEKKSFEYASTVSLEGLRELIYQQKDKIMQLETPAGMDLTPMFYDLQARIMELERRIDDYHSGNWN